jgi:hypothetical protein
VLSRVGAGVAGSLIGCALLGWGLPPIAIGGREFADILNTCSASGATGCTGLERLILLAVPMLLGFSERTLTAFERRVLGKNKNH